MTLLKIKQRCHVKKDTEIRLYLQERKKGMTQRVAAARAGIGERTARKYERAAALPSQLKRPHDWKTRPDPFEQDWPWVVSELERDPALQGSTLFALLCERHPDRYRPTQVRTLQRHIQQWRVLHGPDREVMFAQQHVPGERGQSDFTHMEDLIVLVHQGRAVVQTSPRDLEVMFAQQHVPGERGQSDFTHMEDLGVT